MACRASLGWTPVPQHPETSGMRGTSGIPPGRKTGRCGLRVLKYGSRVVTKAAREPREGGDL
jgi:hypothetical protein